MPKKPPRSWWALAVLAQACWGLTTTTTMMHGQGFGKAPPSKRSSGKRAAPPPPPPTKSSSSKKSLKKKFVRPFASRRVAGRVGPRRDVPQDIARPEYAASGTPALNMRPPWMIQAKTEEEIQKMRAAGRVAREVLDATGRSVKAGMTTDELDAIAHAATLARGAYPSPLNYHGFPKSICTSVNEVICHGIPDDQRLREGDIVNIDVTVFLDGFHGDCSEMFYVGAADHIDSDSYDDAALSVDAASRQLVEVTYGAWQAAAQFCEPGRAYKDIGAVIEDFVAPYGYQSVKQFVGHGIGTVFHDAPNVLHVRNNEPNGIMREGHTFTIEPMICEGTQAADLWKDNWTAATKDLGRSAQFEHTFLVTSTGLEPLTKKLPSSPRQPWEQQQNEEVVLLPQKKTTGGAE